MQRPFLAHRPYRNRWQARLGAWPVLCQLLHKTISSMERKRNYALFTDVFPQHRA